MGLLHEKVALVTGGASGIGRACAEVLAKEGARVLVTDVDPGGLKASVQAIEAAGGCAFSLAHDVTDENAWQAVLSELMERWGGVHILVNNAGIAINGSLLEMSLNDWRQQNAVNLDGVFLGTKHAIPLIHESGGGSIIIMSSIAGLRGSPGLAGYGASKGGVRLFAKSAALECAAAGLKVRVNSVHPGIIDTPLWGKLDPPGGDDRSNAFDAQAIGAGTPAHRAGSAQEIADGVLYLASELSAYVNGSELVIDGGMMAGGGARPAALKP
jgi:NAD(P)-dependent dehydrogenase (short-subunit alcohol dehydrogenase family)